jgi:hypothetical protein
MMLESLAFALVKTFITFMFEQHLENMQSVKLQGAPAWYAQQTRNHICESGYALGGLNAVDASKVNARLSMAKRIQQAMESVAYESYRNRTEPTEQALVKQFTVDVNLPAFINASVVYENIEYREKTMMAYTRVCIPKERMVSYQQERVTLLAKNVSIHRRNRGMDELESEIAQPR